MDKNTQKVSFLKKAGLALGAVGATAVASTSHAAIDFDTADLVANVGAGEAFAITAGLLFIGLSATISVLRKSRGAVR